MSFQPLNRDKDYKYKNGHWTWEKHENKLKFHLHDNDKKITSQRQSEPSGLKFKEHINLGEEKIFREKFVRPETLFDVITLQDIKNLALFTLIPRETQTFIAIIHTEMYDKFLHSVIFYTDFFLLVLELLLIRRDEERVGSIRDTFSLKVERFLSKQLSDRRVLISREYVKILLKCNKEHTSSDTIATRPSAQKDLRFFEALINFTTQCTFIAMHRRAFNAISCELNRLFRTEFFNLARFNRCLCRFSFREQQILFGQSWYENSLKNFRYQNSPLVAELLIATKKKDEILKIGQEKYLGCNKYLQKLELEYTTPEVNLCLIDCRRGILGHPKNVYDTMLNLNEPMVRKMKWSDSYDPYGIVKPVFIEISTDDDFDNRRKNLSARLIVQREASGGADDRSELWRRKEFIMKRDLKMSVMD